MAKQICTNQFITWIRIRIRITACNEVRQLFEPLEQPLTEQGLTGGTTATLQLTCSSGNKIPRCVLIFLYKSPNGKKDNLHKSFIFMIK